jgi:hypothetical protein
LHRAVYVPLAAVAGAHMQPVELDDAAEAELEYADEEDLEGEQELDELQSAMDTQQGADSSPQQASGFVVERLVSTFHPPGRFTVPAPAAQATAQADDSASVASRVSGASGRSGGARSMSDWDEALLCADGAGRVPVLPFELGEVTTWTPFQSTEGPCVPVRAMRFCVPVSLLKRDAKSLSEWSAPSPRSSRRAHAYAAVSSLLFAGTSKGVLSGDHAELQADDEAADDEAGDSSKKRFSRASSYVFHDGSGRRSAMFHYALEHIRDTEGSLVALGIWKLVYNASHSDSHLTSSVLKENAEVHDSVRATKTSAFSRKATLGKEAKLLSNLGDLTGHAGLAYTRLSSLSDLLSELQVLCGADSDAVSRSCFRDRALPSDTLTTPMACHQTLGGVHPLSPEYLYNAKRPCALSFGLINPETGSLLDVDERQLDPATYFSGNVFAPPDDVELFVQKDPFCCSLFGVRFPRPLVDTLCVPGRSLLGCFCDLHYAEAAAGVWSADPPPKVRALAVARFRKFMVSDVEECHTNADSRMFDVLEPSIVSAKKAFAERGGTAAHDGAFLDGTDCALESLCQNTNRLHEMVVLKWKAKGGDHSTFVAATNDLITLHLSRLDAILNSSLKESLPAGFLSWYDGLQECLAQNSGSASIAFREGGGMQKMTSDLTAFGEVWSWIGRLYSSVCSIQGRDRRVMDSIFLTSFEVFSPVTFLTLLCGVRGNGKSLRTERMSALYSPGIFGEAGSSSAKAGYNGSSRATDGRVMVYDEMPADLLARDSTRTDFWKVVPLRRRWTHERTVGSADEFGSKTFKTVKVSTRHRSSYIFCSNHGVSLVECGSAHDPDDSRLALADRAVFEVVRPLAGARNTSDSDFRRLLATPLVQEKLHAFRTLVNLVGICWMAASEVSFLLPDLTAAKSLFAKWDGMLTDRFGLPAISARKSKRREQSLTTMCFLEAVAKMYFFKQTAVESKFGRPQADGTAPRFKLSDLREALTTAAPTPETALMAWSMGLDLSVSTNSAGAHVLTSIAQWFGMVPCSMLRESFSTLGVKDTWFNSDLRRKAADEERKRIDMALSWMEAHPELIPPLSCQRPGSPSVDFAARAQVHRSFSGLPGNIADYLRAGIQPKHPSLARNVSRHIKHLLEQLTAGPIDSDAFLVDRAKGLKKQDAERVLEHLRCKRETRNAFRIACLNSNSPMEDPRAFVEKLGFSVDALAPSASEAGIFHSPRNLLRWSLGETSEVGAQYGPWATRNDRLNFRVLRSDVEASQSHKVLDFSRFEDAKVLSFRDLARRLSAHEFQCSSIGISESSVRDLCHLFSTSEGARFVTDTPSLASRVSAEMAMTTDSEIPLMYGPGVNVTAKLRPPVDVRDLLEDGKSTLDSHIREFAIAGRLPTLMPLLSNRVSLQPICSISPTAGLTCSVSALLQHVSLIAESAIALIKVPGADRPEDGYPCGIASPDEEGQDDQSVRHLGWAFDSLSCYLTLCASQLLVDDLSANSMAAFQDRFGVAFKDEVELCTRYVAFDRTVGQVSLKRNTAPIHESASAYATADLGPSREEVEIDMGRAVSDEEYEMMRQQAGSANASGDGVLLASEFFSQTAESWHSRGFITGHDDPVVKRAADIGCLRVQLCHHVSAHDGVVDGFEHLRIEGLAQLTNQTMRAIYARRKRPADGGGAEHQPRKRSGISVL